MYNIRDKSLYELPREQRQRSKALTTLAYDDFSGFPIGNVSDA